PPSSIPRGNQQQLPSDDEEEVPALPQGRLLPTPNRPLPGQGVPPPGSVQSQPLAPPPGTTVVPQNAPPTVAIAPPEPSQAPAPANADVFVEGDEIPLQGEVKRIFSGWMYAASPGLHGVEHPIYDIWLTDCKAPDQTVVTAAPDPPKSPAQPQPAVQKRPPQQKQTAPRPPSQVQQQAQQPPPPPPPQQQRPGGLFAGSFGH